MQAMRMWRVAAMLASSCCLSWMLQRCRAWRCLENALVGVMFISAVPAYSLPHTAPRLTEQIPEASPLTKQGENLVISWDGVMVPLRGDEETIWKEAAVGRVSIYGKPREEDGKPPLLDSRYFARMPE